MTDTPASQLKDLTIIYVLDPPGLTRDSIILLSSIRQTLGDVKVIAYTPEAKQQFLLPYVREFYDRMGAEIRLFAASEDFAAPYKQGNKIMACLQKRDTPYTLFLDTDTAIVEPFTIADLFGPDEVSVAPEGVQGWGGNPGSWEYVYEKFGLPFPEERVKLARSGKMVPPYFNAGMIAFPTHSGFAENWYKTAIELDHDPDVKNKRPWLDQIALPLAIKRAGLKNRVMDRMWNLSISHPGHAHHHPKFFADVNSVDARIVHFHQPKFFNGTKFLPTIDEAMGKYTIFEKLSDLTAQGDARQQRRTEVWTRFGELKKIPPRERTPEINAEMRALGREKDFIKSFRNNLDRQIEYAPDTIVKPL